MYSYNEKKYDITIKDQYLLNIGFILYYIILYYIILYYIILYYIIYYIILQLYYIIYYIIFYYIILCLLYFIIIYILHDNNYGNFNTNVEEGLLEHEAQRHQNFNHSFLPDSRSQLL